MTECRFCLCVATDQGEPRPVETRVGGTAEQIWVCPGCRDALELIGVEVVNLVEGYPEDKIHTGETLVKSSLTGETYRATKWVDKSDGHSVALEKKPVDDRGDA
jgi:hypothetical protein